ncbi:Sad1-interacting factor 3 [Savitreella phatthalungensis]
MRRASSSGNGAGSGMGDRSGGDRSGRPASDNRGRRNPLPGIQLPAGRLKNISMDSLLANVDQVPSARKRTPAVTFAGAPPQVRKGAPPSQIQARQPQRTTKTSEKVVFIPESYGSLPQDDSDDDSPPGASGGGIDEDRMSTFSRSRRSIAERLTKERRDERHLPRVTAYCVADSFRIQKTTAFLRSHHEVRPRIYDDLLYAAYYLPLLSGHEDRSRVRSSPALRTSEGESVLDRQADAAEARDHVYMEPDAGGDERPLSSEALDEELVGSEEPAEERRQVSRRDSNPQPQDLPALYKVAEVFILSYGVIVFWNFSEKQERNILADLTFAQDKTLMSRRLADTDVETEEFHFEYSPNTRRPRIYNDMITLRSSDHFVKMAMSHAIAQSVKLSFFEGRMDESMTSAANVPKKLATSGELKMTRAQVMKMSGHLFKLRVDVNLSSNILDTPDFFWESEPTLNPLYTAVRDYLEIRTRTTLLNQRCQVVFDLLDILSESIADSNMHRITWIVIALILISVIVTTFEVSLRFAIIQRNKGGKQVLEQLVAPLLGIEHSTL